MRTTQLQGERHPRRAHWFACGLWLMALAGCQAVAPEAESGMADDLAEMQIRIRLLQTELALLRSTLTDRHEDRERRGDQQRTLQASVDALQARIESLPEALNGLCPEPPAAATVNTQCETGPNAQRVVVSGDKLVLGQVERVWIDPPAVFLEAKIDAGAEISRLDAAELVEFERDGTKWVRFQLAAEPDPAEGADVEAGAEPAIVERPLKRYVRVPDSANGGGGRHPAVDIRVQIGDVREQVEVVLADIELPQPLVLGRNFLTDVALVDVARQFVQPAFRAPE